MTQFTVVIIGGGIGGLFAANALIARGFDVSVYEQAPALGEVGAGVFLTPNSVRQLQRVGLGDQVERRGARVANGAVAEGDVVIAADGIHSDLRPFAAPPSRPVFHGSVAYRGVLPHRRIPHWPTDCWQMWLGRGKHFLSFPVRSGELINYVGFVPADAEMQESWSAPGDPDVLRREFEGWDPRIEILLSQVEKTFRWALYDREPLPTWTRGRLTLLGDAAHPMLPHLGQGANQSIEDGMALATILALTSRAGVPAALLAYERLRRERVAAVQRGARENGMRYDSSYADLGVRDAEISAHAAFRKRLYDHDVVPEAQAAAAALS